MAKSPRKRAAVAQKSAGYAQKLNPKVYKPMYAGKNFKSYKNITGKRNGRLSIAPSSSSDSDAKSHKYASDSDSESSLTALSESEEDAASRRGSAFFESNKRTSKLTKSVRATKSTKKRVHKKVYQPQDYDVDSEDDEQAVGDDNDDDSDENDGDADENSVRLGSIYQMMSTKYGSSDSESNEESQDENDVSSSDDSEVDFVQLQAERKAHSGKTTRKATKSLQGIKSLKALQAPKKKRRTSSGYRRKSEVALPDINFKFEFDDATNEAVIEEESDEEDIGEEVDHDPNHYNLEFQFDEPLINVPKIKDDELNSEDDYEYDDNDLLATLQADNDIEEFITGDAPTPVIRTRQSSLGSLGDDTEDPFLREEEKYLVNEFETNGFDDDEELLQTARVMDSFNPQPAEVLEYASSSENSQDEEITTKVENSFDDDDVDDFIDFADFDVPLFENDADDEEKTPKKTDKEKKKRPAKHKRKGPLDSEEEDDSYLWNYFFSSDAESNNESEPDAYDVEEQLILEEIFRKDKQEAQQSPMEAVEEPEYDSGESTDVDVSLPPSQNQLGSKMAKEVLSSKTADYRPPVLGTWVAIDSEPFGIIDGLSTRTLNNTQAKNPRKGWRSINFGQNESEDLAIELDELLNISELDNDDENDIRIWRDFNNRKKQVPLGAFRNKSHLNQPVIVPEPMAGFSTSKMNTDFNSRRVSGRPKKKKPPTPKKDIASKLKRRRASNAGAVSEGYRPTKSGLFSENVLADVEEVLGDDRDFMALIKGL